MWMRGAWTETRLFFRGYFALMNILMWICAPLLSFKAKWLFRKSLWMASMQQWTKREVINRSLRSFTASKWSSSKTPSFRYDSCCSIQSLALVLVSTWMFSAIERPPSQPRFLPLLYYLDQLNRSSTHAHTLKMVLPQSEVFPVKRDKSRHTSSLILEHLFWTGFQSDFVLESRDRSFKVHKAIVCQQCPYLDRLCNAKFQVSRIIHSDFPVKIYCSIRATK